MSSSAFGATSVTYSNYTPGNSSTYNTGAIVELKSNTELFDPTGFGVLIPGSSSEVLSISFNLTDPMFISSAAFVIPIKINNPGSNSKINFSFFRGNSLIGGFGPLQDEDFILDGQFHEYLLSGPVNTISGQHRIDIRLDHDPAAGQETGTMSVSFAAPTGSSGTASASRSYLNLAPVSTAVPAFYLGGTPVPEPGAFTICAIAMMGLLKRRRASAL